MSTKTTIMTTPPEAAGAEPAPPVRLNGRVHYVYRDRGFGFIRCLEGPDRDVDFFFHMSDVLDGFNALVEGQVVTFEPHERPKGKRASGVRRKD